MTHVPHAVCRNNDSSCRGFILIVPVNAQPFFMSFLQFLLVGMKSALLQLFKSIFSGESVAFLQPHHPHDGHIKQAAVFI